MEVYTSKECLKSLEERVADANAVKALIDKKNTYENCLWMYYYPTDPCKSKKNDWDSALKAVRGRGIADKGP